MNNKNTHSFWEKVLIHEAGHAVAALSLIDQAADIIVKEARGSEVVFSGAYTLKDSILTPMDPDADPVAKIMRYAAGAKAEEICLGVTASEGFAGDRAIINIIRAAWARAVDEDEIRKQWAGTPVLEAALAKIPDRARELAAIDHEIESNFERTQRLVVEHRDVIKRIGAGALCCLLLVGDTDLFDRMVLLSSASIRSFWTAA